MKILENCAGGTNYYLDSSESHQDVPNDVIVKPENIKEIVITYQDEHGRICKVVQQVAALIA